MGDRIDIVLGDLSTFESMSATLAAERAIHKTFCDYLFFIDNRAFEQAAACFTHDTTVTYQMVDGPPIVTRGREKYCASLQGITEGRTIQMTAHVLGQYVMTWEAGKAKVEAYVSSWQWYGINEHLGDLRPADFSTIGHSQDEFEYVDGHWLIASRSVRPVAGLTATGSASQMAK